MTTYTFVIPGEIVPYTRVGRERWTRRARRYFASRDRLRDEIALATSVLDGERAGEWRLRMTFWRWRAAGDLTNLLKAIEDAAEGVLYDNDRQVSYVEARRVRCERGCDAVAVEAVACGGEE